MRDLVRFNRKCMGPRHRDTGCVLHTAVCMLYYQHSSIMSKQCQGNFFDSRAFLIYSASTEGRDRKEGTREKQEEKPQQILSNQSEFLSIQVFPKFHNGMLVRHQEELFQMGLYVVIAMPLGSYKPDPANPDQHPTRLQGPCFPTSEEKKTTTHRKQQNPQNHSQTPIFLLLISSRKPLVKDQGKQWSIYRHNSSERMFHVGPVEYFSQNIQQQLLKIPLTTTILSSEEALRGTQLVSHQKKTNNDSVSLLQPPIY